MKPILSILTPSVPSRIANFSDIYNAYPGPLLKLIEKLEDQIGTLNVEHLILTDNKRRSVGAKRQALLEMARGEYVSFVDDDDTVSDDYIQELLPRCQSGPDVVTFEQAAIINGVEGQITFDAASKVDEPWRAGGIAKRRPWHVCAWRRDLALCGVFTEKNYGEDADWVNQVAPLVRTHLHIPKVLHYYLHDSKMTEAPSPL
jgi:glycosyltransferase involved in cell wall biosynthesis